MRLLNDSATSPTDSPPNDSSDLFITSSSKTKLNTADGPIRVPDPLTILNRSPSIPNSPKFPSSLKFFLPNSQTRPRVSLPLSSVMLCFFTVFSSCFSELIAESFTKDAMFSDIVNSVLFILFTDARSSLERLFTVVTISAVFARLCSTCLRPILYISAACDFAIRAIDFVSSVVTLSSSLSSLLDDAPSTVIPASNSSLSES